MASTKGEGDEIELKLDNNKAVNHVILMEAIEHGEKVRKYMLKGKSDNGQWVNLSQGSCVGHKRIEKFDTQNLSSLKLFIEESAGKPEIRKFSAIHV